MAQEDNGWTHIEVVAGGGRTITSLIGKNSDLVVGEISHLEQNTKLRFKTIVSGLRGLITGAALFAMKLARSKPDVIPTAPEARSSTEQPGIPIKSKDLR